MSPTAHHCLTLGRRTSERGLSQEPWVFKIRALTNGSRHCLSFSTIQGEAERCPFMNQKVSPFQTLNYPRALVLDFSDFRTEKSISPSTSYLFMVSVTAAKQRRQLAEDNGVWGVSLWQLLFYGLTSVAFCTLIQLCEVSHIHCLPVRKTVCRAVV